MKVLGLITEYNPFHYGHKYHLEKSMEKTNSTHSIAVMSGSFVQRGEPSIVDKWSKAKMAILNGVDLVIELPFVYSSQSAELFAHGAVKLLDNTNVVDYLCFGSEAGKLDPLKKLAKVFVEEPPIYQKSLKHFLSLGYSFSVSRSNAVDQYLNSESLEYSTLLKGSNNILGIEYLKAIYNLNSNIEPVAIKRMGSDYKEVETLEGFASATSIRHKILRTGLSSIKNLLPIASYQVLKEYKNSYKHFNRLENYEEIFNYLLLTTDSRKLKEMLYMEEGLENRILSKSNLSKDINYILKSITTKRYPLTRIQRIFIHMLNNIDKENIKHLYNSVPNYIRVLGSNKKGYEILNKIKSDSNINIITK
ncbi:MAG: nucleotidyltransferase, partial [Tissierellia bacterium]|nr:nucleotidyltransferase [Tissierellia bacterium]